MCTVTADKLKAEGGKKSISGASWEAGIQGNPETKFSHNREVRDMYDITKAVLSKLSLLVQYIR